MLFESEASDGQPCGLNPSGPGLPREALKTSLSDGQPDGLNPSGPEPLLGLELDPVGMAQAVFFLCTQALGRAQALTA